jgi:hypothetical protein
MQERKVIQLPVENSSHLKGLIFEESTKKEVKQTSSGLLLNFLLPCLFLMAIGLLIANLVKPSIEQSKLTELERVRQELQRVKECVR